MSAGAGRGPGDTAPVSRRRALKALAAAGVLAAAAGLAARARWVNASALQPPETIAHSMGEWFDLDGAFLSSSLEESTRGYSMCVSAARLLSYNEYVSAYANDGSRPLHLSNQELSEKMGVPLERVGKGLDTPSIVCLDLDLSKTKSEGVLPLGLMYLVPKRANEYLISDRSLIERTIESWREGVNLLQSMVIRDNTQFTFHPAYRRQGADVNVDGTTLNRSLLREVADTEFLLVASNAPVRHVINVSV